MQLVIFLKRLFLALICLNLICCVKTLAEYQTECQSYGYTNPNDIAFCAQEREARDNARFYDTVRASGEAYNAGQVPEPRKSVRCTTYYNSTTCY